MKKRAAALWEGFLDLFEDDDDPDEPFYDPVHLGAAIVCSLTGIGALYWLLWTLLVYEGGLFLKLSAAAELLFTAKTAADFGYEGAPYAMGVFEGWLGNLLALLIAGVVLAALHRLYFDAAQAQRARK